MTASHAYIYTYQTVCETNGKTYIGVHSTNKINDGYIGCGVFSQNFTNLNTPFHNAVKKYGYTSFKKYILCFFDTYGDALEEEKYLVNENWVKKESNYNCAIGGRGNTLSWMSKEQREEHKNKYRGVRNHRYGKKAKNRRQVLKYDLSNNLISEFDSIQDAADSVNDCATNILSCCIGKYGQCKGFIFRYKYYSEEEKIKLDSNLKKRKRIYNSDGTFKMTEELKNMLSLQRVGKKKKPFSEEIKKKMSLARIGKKLKPHSEETKRKIGLANKKNKK